jgi:D-alanine-D-alanine ligase
MRIAIAFTVKRGPEWNGAGARAGPASFHLATDDAEEEFDCPETVEAIAAVLRESGHDVELFGDGEDFLRRVLDGPRPDLVFNIAEGRGVSRCRESRVPAVLDLLGVPHTGSDALTLAATLDKDCAKRLVRDAGVATPAWVLVEEDSAAARAVLEKLPLPAIVKPNCEGSSKGIRSTAVVERREGLAGAVASTLALYRQPVLVEEFIDGDELTVGVLGNRRPEVIGILRVLPKVAKPNFVYSLEVKRDWRRQVVYECPARLSPADGEAVRASALAAFRALGCRDVARVDFRLRGGVPYFLEANPLPGLSPESGDIVILARAMGLEHRELVLRIVLAACERVGLDMAPAAHTPSLAGR